MGKEMLLFFQYVIGKKKLLVKIYDRKKIENSSCYIVYVCLKQYVGLDMDDPISYLS